MKTLKLLVAIIAVAVVGAISSTTNAQTILWKCESDTISASTFINKDIALTDDGNILLTYSYQNMKAINEQFELVPYLFKLNSSTGEEIFVKKYTDSSLRIIQKIDEDWSGWDGEDSTFIPSYDTTYDTTHALMEVPIKTINMSDNEYWMVGGSYWYYAFFLQSIPFPYLIKMDKDGNVKNRINIQQELYPSKDYDYKKSLRNEVTNIFYDTASETFINIPPNSNFIIIQRFDKDFHPIGDEMQEGFEYPITNGIMSSSVKAVRLANNRYLVCMRFYSANTQMQRYDVAVQRIYDANFNIIFERKRLRDDVNGVKDAGIYWVSGVIPKDDGGYIIYNTQDNINFIIEEYASNGDSVRTNTLNFADRFATGIFTPSQMLLANDKFLFIGYEKVVVDAYNTTYTMNLVETDLQFNVRWATTLPTAYNGTFATAVAGKEPETYLISGTNTLQNNQQAHLFNVITFKISGTNGINEPLISTIKLYPNPATDHTTLTLELQQASQVHISLNDMLGREIKQIYNAFTDAGTFTHSFATQDLPRGIYYLKILSGGEVKVEKVVVN
ncbi:MAG: T9SS type A sorting domain-containing protein [Ignavibacteria bacterium]|jgi:hypothetical protein|nr:T9SS type A sorting domain-containing protein [Ignavibacteria bacterium]